MIGVLANRTYRHLFAAQALSLIGTGLTTVALALLAWELAGDRAGTVLGTALALKMVAYVVIAPIAGAFAAQFPRRALLVVLDLCRAALVLLLPFVTEIWQIYTLVFAFQAFSAAFTPTFQATIPDVLPNDRDYTNALSLSRLAYDLESLLSPLLAGVLLAFVSFHWLFAGTTIGFIASALLVLSVTLPPARLLTSARSIMARLSHGTRLYLATPRLRGLLALSVAVAAGGSMVIVNTVVYVREVLGGSEQDVALLFAAYGFGSMATAILLPRLLDRVSARTVMLPGALVLTVGLLAGISGPGFVTLAFLWALLGVGASLIQTPAGLLLRRSSAEAERPALFAAQFALSHLCWLACYPLAGWAGVAFGLDGAFALMMVMAAAGGAAAWALWHRAGE
jgi:MFS family permease